MAGIFTPQGDFNITPPAPVADPRPVGGDIFAGISNLLGTFAPGSTTRSSGPTQAQTETAAMVGFRNGLLEVAALRQSGDEAGAHSEFRRLVANAAPDINVSSDQVGTMVSAITGYTVDQNMHSQEERQFMAWRDSEESRAYILDARARARANGLELNEQEILSVAYNTYSRQQTSEAVSMVNWQSGGESLLVETIKTYGNAMGEMILQAQEAGKAFSQQDVDEIKAQVALLRQNIEGRMNSGGIPEEDRKLVNSQLGALDNALAALDNLSGENLAKAMTGDALVATLSFFSDHPDLSESQKNLITAIISNEGAFEFIVGRDIAQISEILEVVSQAGAAEDSPFFDTSSLTALGAQMLSSDYVPGGVPGGDDVQITTQQANPELSEALLNPWEGYTPNPLQAGEPDKVLGQVGNVFGISGSFRDADLESESGFRAAYSLLSAGSYALRTSGRSGEWRSADGLDKIFDGGVIATLQKMGQSKPDETRVVLARLRDGLRAQHSAATRAAHVTFGPNSSYSYLDRDDYGNLVVIDKEGYLRSGGVENEGIRNAILSVANDYYNGDLLSMVRDGGSKIPEGQHNRDALLNRIAEVGTSNEQAIEIVENQVAAIDKLNLLLKQVRLIDDSINPNLEADMAALGASVGSSNPQSVSTPASTQQSATQIDRVIGGIVSSLISTEAERASPEAWGSRNSYPSASGMVGGQYIDIGHYGRLQFSPARLEDAVRAGVMPRDMTIEEFLQNKNNIQPIVEQWHISDTIKNINSAGLNSHIGEVIDGTIITLEGMVAAAHLGGFAGMRRFIESGGTDDRSDAGGTTMLSYLTRHSSAGSVVSQFSDEELQNVFGEHWDDVDIGLANGLTGLLQAANEAGFEVSVGNSFRSAETQAQILANNMTRPERGGFTNFQRTAWMTAVEEVGPIAALQQNFRGKTWEEWFTNTPNGNSIRKWIALPGSSQHQHGTAADLQYGSDEARSWIHANAGRFGLHFRLDNEPWHIEPIGGATGTTTHGTRSTGRGDTTSVQGGGTAPVQGDISGLPNVRVEPPANLNVASGAPAVPLDLGGAVEEPSDDSGSAAAQAAEIANAQTSQALSGDVLRAKDANLPPRLWNNVKAQGAQNAPVVETQEEAERLIDEGILHVGDIVIIGGRIRAVTTQMADGS